MALLFMDGFDKYGTTTGSQAAPLGIMRTRWQQRQNRAFVKTGRWGDYAITVAWDANAWIQTPHLTTDSTLIVGFALKIPSSHGTGEFIQMRSATNAQNDTTGGIWATIDANEAIHLYRGPTLLGSTANSIVTENAWHYFELKVYCHDSAGTYEMRIDGVDVLSATSVDTKYGTDNYHSVVRFNGVVSTGDDYSAQIDDLYICDGTGSENNDFIGPNIRVVTLSPNADGDSSDWTTSTGNTHYTLVDEDEQNSAEYVEDTTTNNTDLYEYESLPVVNIADPIAVNVVSEFITTEPNNWTIETVVKHSTTEDADSGQVVATDDWVALSRLLEENPVTTNAWTTSDVNNLQAGVKVG